MLFVYVKIFKATRKRLRERAKASGAALGLRPVATTNVTMAGTSSNSGAAQLIPRKVNEITAENSSVAEVDRVEFGDEPTSSSSTGKGNKETETETTKDDPKNKG